MEKRLRVQCLMPVYNDWESFAMLADRLRALEAARPNFSLSILAVNDGSIDPTPEMPAGIPVTVVNLKTNIGHQRAIAVGLQYHYSECEPADFVIVMDSDGEDRPEDIPALVEKAQLERCAKIIFAQRKRRRESALFKAGYRLYKFLFQILTGQTINFGNFSAIPCQLLNKVVYQNNIWNHYSGGIIQSRIGFDKVRLDRGQRFAGMSKMNSNSLILHGLSSISVYFDFLSLRILKFSMFGIFICFISVLFILYQKYVTYTAIPGWASSLILIISVIILQLFSVTLIVLLLQLSSRKNVVPPNAYIYREFIASVDAAQ